VTAAVVPLPAPALASLLTTLAAVRARRGDAPVHGLAPGLVIDNPRGWVPATALADGSLLDDMVQTAATRWETSPHVGAALAWKCYSYWVALPAVLGWASSRRVPLMTADATLVRYAQRRPFMHAGLRKPTVAVLRGDPLASGRRRPGIQVVDSEAELLEALRVSLLDDHLLPVLEQLHGRVRLGRRTLLGSVASGVSYALARASDSISGPAIQAAQTVLGALGVDDLVDLGTAPDGELTVQRRTCCLAFSLPEPKVCASCCIR
jgi:hypothetical protein